jgi:hypothetical protein
VRHRATRPAFTVEVKRRRLSSTQDLTTPESYRPQSETATLGHEPSARSRVSWGDLIKNSHSHNSKPSLVAEAGSLMFAVKPAAKIRTGRILPDILGAQLAEERIRQENEEQATKHHARRSKAKGDNRSQRLRAETQPHAEDANPHEIAPEGQTSPVTLAVETEQPLLDTKWVEAGGHLASTIAMGDTAVSTHTRGRAKDKRGLSPVQCRAKRRGMPIPLQRGERWKRRLPEVCWSSTLHPTRHR